jgi:hypothetical protein
MYFDLGFHFFNGLCPGLVDILSGDESTAKDLKLLIIGLLVSLLSSLVSIFSQKTLISASGFFDWLLSWPVGVPLFHLFRFCSMAV